MNNVVSLVVRPLYSLVAIFFFVITVQPIAAAGRYQAELAEIEKYVNGRSMSDIASELGKLPASTDSLQTALQSSIFKIKDANGNNLFHRILERGEGIGVVYEALRVCGPKLLIEHNTKGLTPIQVSPDNLEVIFGTKEGNGTKLIHIKTRLIPLLKENIESFIFSYLDTKSTLNKKTSEYEKLPERDWDKPDPDQDKRDALERERYELTDEQRRIAHSLGVLIRVSDFRINSQQVPIEGIDHHEFYSTLSETEQGKQFLRKYRTQEGKKSLYNYFNEKTKDDGGELSYIKRDLLKLYYGAGVPVPTAAEIDIASIGPDRDFRSFLETPDGKNFFEQYKNSQGQNLAFIAANDVRLLEKMKDQGVDVMGMLQAKDIHGNDGISQIRDTWGYKGVVSDTVFELIKEKAAHRREKEQEEQERIWRQEQEEQERLHEEALASGIKAVNAKPFNDGWWHEVIVSFSLGGRPQEFASISLEAILHQNSSPLRSAFLQQNPKDFADQADQLWSSFFATYDALVHQAEQDRGYGGGYGRHNDFDEKMLARPIGVLNIFVHLENGMMGQEPNPAVIETIRTLQSNVLATGGTFGMNFNRTANEHEARIMIEQLTNLGMSIFEPRYRAFNDPIDEFMKNKTDRDLSEISKFIRARDSGFDEELVDIDDASERIFSNIVSPFVYEIADEIAGRFFVPYLGLSLEQEFKLEEHQANCAVMALYRICESIYHEDYIFSAMDEILGSRPRMEYKNSRQRYKEVMQMAGHDMERMRTPLSSGRNSRSGSVGGDDLGEN